MSHSIKDPNQDNNIILLLCVGVVVALALMVGVVNKLYPQEGEYIPLERITPIDKPNILPLECGIERVVPVESFRGSFLPGNGLEVYTYDTDGDGQRDVEIAIPEGDENRYPLFYFFDRKPYDDQPDIGYVDKLRDGTCHGIHVYWTPHFDPKEQA